MIGSLFVVAGAVAVGAFAYFGAGKSRMSKPALVIGRAGAKFYKPARYSLLDARLPTPLQIQYNRHKRSKKRRDRLMEVSKRIRLTPELIEMVSSEKRKRTARTLARALGRHG